MLKWLVTLVLFTFSFSLHAEEAVEGVPQLEALSSTDKGYSILLPHGWKIERNVLGNIDVMAVNTETGQSISIIVTKDSTLSFSLKEYVDEGLKQIRAATQDFQLVDTGNEDLAGHDAMWVLYTGSVQHQRARAKVLQVFTSVNNRVYVITFGALEPDFDVSRPYFDDILKSFKFVQ
jgi:hypothetical protein